MAICRTAPDVCVCLRGLLGLLLSFLSLYLLGSSQIASNLIDLPSLLPLRSGVSSAIDIAFFCARAEI
jgi:hypothetical protein